MPTSSCAHGKSRTGGFQRITGVHTPTGSLWCGSVNPQIQTELILASSSWLRVPHFQLLGFFQGCYYPHAPGVCRDLAGEPESRLLQSGLSRVERALWLSLMGRRFQDSRLRGTPQRSSGRAIALTWTRLPQGFKSKFTDSIL